MTRTIVAVYNNFDNASRAVTDLQNAGFARADISLIANDAKGHYKGYLEGKPIQKDVKPAEGAAVGAGFGALTGALVGLGALVIPGVGPVIAAGPLAAALTGGAVGAAAGAVTGGITAALVEMGVHETEAAYYAEGIRRGGTLVTVKSTDAMADKAVSILRSHYPVDMDRTVQNWRSQGWQGFDVNAKPYDYSVYRIDEVFYVPEDVNNTPVRTY